MNTRIDVHGMSLRGREHRRNQDHFAIATLSKSMRLHQTNLDLDDESRMHGTSQGHLFLVADGIEGGENPSRASGTAIDSVMRYFLNEMPWHHIGEGAPEDVRLALADAMRNAQEDLLARSGPGSMSMGSALTLALVFWPELYVAHVGANRAYVHDGSSLERITTDHTLAEVRRELGGHVTRASEAVLWNALGGNDGRVQPEIVHHTLRFGSTLALVSDGVGRSFVDGEMERILDGSESAEEVCSRLVGEPGQDDHTAVVVRFLPHQVEPAVTVPAPGPDPLGRRSPVDRPSERRVPVRDLPGVAACRRTATSA